MGYFQEKGITPILKLEWFEYRNILWEWVWNHQYQTIFGNSYLVGTILKIRSHRFFVKIAIKSRKLIRFEFQNHETMQFSKLYDFLN